LCVCDTVCYGLYYYYVVSNLVVCREVKSLLQKIRNKEQVFVEKNWREEELLHTMGSWVKCST
jgi:hypothetical protein